MKNPLLFPFFAEGFIPENQAATVYRKYLCISKELLCSNTVI